MTRRNSQSKKKFLSVVEDLLFPQQSKKTKSQRGGSGHVTSEEDMGLTNNSLKDLESLLSLKLLNMKGGKNKKSTKKSKSKTTKKTKSKTTKKTKSKASKKSKKTKRTSKRKSRA